MSHDDEDVRERGTARGPGTGPGDAAGDAAGLGDDADPDSGYAPDPDAAPTVEGRVAQATAELRALLRSSLVATIAVGAAVAVVERLVGSGGAHTSVGYLVGALLATLNLWILGGGFVALMRGDPASVRALLAFGGSFLALVLVAFIVVFARRQWTLGFALGLATPAVAGMLYAWSRRDSDVEWPRDGATRPGGTEAPGDDDGAPGAGGADHSA